MREVEVSHDCEFIVGDWRVLPSRNVIIRECQEVKVEPGTMNVLVYLAGVPGQVVSTAELIGKVWHGRIVDENQVYKRVAQLREAFGGGELGKAVIETIPKRGYRLVAPVDKKFDISGVTSAKRHAARSPTWSSSRYLALALIPIGIMLAVWVTGTADFSADRASPVDDADEIVRIAALPFEFLSADPSDAFLAVGLHREIISQLTRLDRVGVIAATTMDQYAGSTLTMAQIGDELGVDAVLEGAVSYDDDQLRLVLSLIDVETSESIWGDTYQYELTNILDVQLTIADQVASRLEAQLPNSERARLASMPPVNSEAYQAYLRGVASTGNLSPLSFGLNDELHFFLREASDLDRDFSLPNSRRALDYAQSLLRPISRADEAEFGREARERLTVDLANRALEIDAGDPLAHAALGWVAYLRGDTELGKDRFEAALRFSPYDRDVLIDYAYLSARVEPEPKSLQLAQRVFLVDPYVAPNFVGFAHWIQGDLVAAVDALESSQASGAPVRYRHLLRAEIEVARGNYAQAMESLRLDELQLANNQPLPTHAALRCYLYGRLGATQDADRQFQIFKALEADYHVGALNSALAYLGMHNQEEALILMQQAASESVSDHGWIRRQEIVANLYSDPVLDQDEFAEVRSRL